MELVDRLAADLAVLRRRHRSRQLTDELRQRVEDAKGVAAAAREAERSAFDAAAEARNAEGRAAKRYAEAGERYRTQGGDLLEQRDSAEARAAELRKERSNIDDELREIAAGAAPLLQVASSLRELAARARREADAARDQVVLDVLDARDVVVLDQLRAARVRESAVSAVEAFMAADRGRRRDAAGSEPVIGLGDPAPVEFLISQALPDTRRRIQGLLVRRAEADAQLESAERLLTAIPHPEAVAPIRADHQQARERLLRAEAERAHAEERLRILIDQRERAVAVYEKAMDDADDDRRLVDHAERVRITLDALKADATRRHLDRISTLVLDSLRNLMRKENLITEITIDPVTYAVELRGSSGQPLTAEQLSVGERQLLAVALLWGLARASGQPLPVVIDTPLGRLDSAHRHHLLSRYFPHASHQVVLLSTDTEIGADAWKELAPHIGLSYRLEFDPAAGASTVHPGYFWEQ